MNREKIRRAGNKLKDQALEHPVETIVIATAAATAVAKLMAANAERKNSKTWAKEVDRRRAML
jgi:hypothetical protein